MKIPFGTCRSFFHVDSFMSDLFNKGGFKSSHDGFASALNHAGGAAAAVDGGESESRGQGIRRSGGGAAGPHALGRRPC